MHEWQFPADFSVEEEASGTPQQMQKKYLITIKITRKHTTGICSCSQDPALTYLFPSPGVRRGDEFVDGVARDAAHGGESHQPADEVGPSRELVVHVLRR